MTAEITFAVRAMLDTVVFSRIRAAASRFAGANQGNIAILFGIAVVPIISFVGAAVDYTRANSARSSMQAALDSTALMLAKDLTDGTITTSQINAKAETISRPSIPIPMPSRLGSTRPIRQHAGNGSTIVVNGNGNIDTSFMRLAGIPNINFNISATSAWGNVRMRVAMALDVTGSMRDDGKMPAMQTAAKSLIDQLSPLAKNPGDIYISIVPFAKDVNLGASYYNETWIDWSVWEDANNTMGTCSNTNYTTRITARTTVTPGRPITASGPAASPTATRTTTPRTRHRPRPMRRRWSLPRNTSSILQDGQRPLYAADHATELRLDALKTMIGTLQPTGNTNQGIGLAWGWLTLGGGAVQCAGEGYRELYL